MSQERSLARRPEPKAKNKAALEEKGRKWLLTLLAVAGQNEKKYIYIYIYIYMEAQGFHVSTSAMFA